MLGVGRDHSVAGMQKRKPSNTHGGPGKTNSEVNNQVFTPCGRFLADFAGVCRLQGVSFVPEVVPRPIPPCKMELKRRKTVKVEPEVEVRASAGQRRGKQQAKRDSPIKDSKTVPSSRPVSVAPSPSLRAMSIGDLPVQKPPTTYLTKDKFDYFKPCIQVEMDRDDDDRTVTEVYVRGWRVDMAMMSVFQHCWPLLSLLHTVHLWNTGLDADTLPLLASFLPLCTALRTLVLDNNPLEDLQVSALLAKDSRLQHLSLRFCGLTDVNAQGLATALHFTGPSHIPLAVLNLSANKIGDAGASRLADSLQTNRSLTMLNLSANSIGDHGTRALAEALTWFRVSRAQVTARRQLIHLDLETEPFPCPNKAAPSRTPGDVATLRMSGSARGGKRSVQVNRRRSIQGLDSKHKVKAGEHNQPQGAGVLVKVLEEQPEPRPRSRRPACFSESDVEVAGQGHGNHPLLQTGYMHDGDLWLPGNQALLSLNLSRNRVGEAGLQALYAALEHQTLYSPDGLGSGLRRLSVHHNAFPPSSPVAARLAHRVKLRDPDFRSPRMDIGKPLIPPCAMPVDATF